MWDKLPDDNKLPDDIAALARKADIGNPGSLKGVTPESWCCIDCGFNTAPSCKTRVEYERAFAGQKALGIPNDQQSVEAGVDNRSEIYSVRDAVWKKAGMAPWGGCLCIGCLEQRIGRKLKPRDFERDHPFNSPHFPATPRLTWRRERVVTLRPGTEEPPTQEEFEQIVEGKTPWPTGWEKLL
jgi:hypothetical protein